MDQTPAPESKRTVVIVIICILLGANLLLIWQFFEKKKHLEEVTKTLEITTSDKDQLAAELQKIKIEYEKINTENADLHGQLAGKEEEIKQKIAEIQRLINSGDAEALKKAKEEIATLKSMNQKYSDDIDALKTANQQLTSKNTQLTSNIEQQQSQIANLSEQNTVLANKVAIGSVLRANNIVIKGIRVKNSGKESETTRASRVSKFLISCTILENKVVDAGTRDVFVRVLSPDGAVMSTSQETFNYNGQSTLYSAKESVDYQNKDTEFSVYWTKGSSYLKGKYLVEIYCGSNLLGSAFLDLK